MNFDPSVLHPDTSPEAIAAAQREVVAVVAFGVLRGRRVAGPEHVSRISDLSILPAWNVRRRLAELGYRVKEASPCPAAPRRRKGGLITYRPAPGVVLLGT